MVFVTPVVGHWLELEIAQWVHSNNGNATRERLDKDNNKLTCQ